MSARRIVALLLIGAGVLVLTLKFSHVYDPVPPVDRFSAKLAAKASPGISKVLRQVRTGQVVFGALVIIPLGIGAGLLLTSRGAKSEPREKAVPSVASRAAVIPASRLSKQASIHSCNVLQVGVQERQLWRFDARNGGFVLSREQTALSGEPLPRNLVARDWHSLFQRKLNIAWLPADQVFLRVAQLPQSEFGETLAMAELQLEKLSPMPVAQIVWSLHVLPQSQANMQTVIVIIVARNVVEEFLGQLEGQGFLADRLELPLLDQLQATAITEDGAWIYPDAPGGANSALVAWWYGGTLQNLDLINLPPTGRAASLKEQLMQMAWAGELEGWLTAPPRWRLVTDEGAAAEWEPALREGLGQPIEIVPPLRPPDLAALTARRAAHAGAGANLLPAEFSTRYQQQFIDRLWIRGLFAVGALYVAGVLIYFVLLGVLSFQTHRVEGHVADLGSAYTNAIRLEDRYKVLKDREDLKFAALDCWEALAELMPDTITLEDMNFNEGKRLSLRGTAPNDQVQQLINFQAALRKATKESEQLFDSSKGDSLNWHVNPGAGAQTVSWSFGLELKRTELE